MSTKALPSSHSKMSNDDDDNLRTTVKFLIHYQQQATVIYLPHNLTLETFYQSYMFDMSFNSN